MLVVSAGRKETAGAANASNAAAPARTSVWPAGVRALLILVSVLVIGIVLPPDLSSRVAARRVAGIGWFPYLGTYLRLRPWSGAVSGTRLGR
jgi:hypothetical protein